MKDIILIPTYNEKGNIGEVIAHTRRVCPLAEIRVIDDNSPDGTGELVRRISSADPLVKLVSRTQKKGLGEAYKDILRQIQKEKGIRYIITLDADGSHDPAAIPSLVNALEAGKDLAIGSRYVSGGKIVGWSTIRHVLSWCGNIYTRIITGSPVHDGTAGFVAFKAERIRTLNFDTISGHGYAYQIEFKNALIKASGSWKEIPITFVERKTGISKISVKIIGEGILMPWRILMKDRVFSLFLLCLCAVIGMSFLLFDHSVIQGDGVSYVDAMKTVFGAPLPSEQIAANFAMHRILTTFLPLIGIYFVSKLLGSLILAWMLWSISLFLILSITFYRLLEKMFKSRHIALIGGLFLATNYAVITAGFGFFMDIGGWMWYILSIYFLYQYLDDKNDRNLWIAALACGVGGFFKENALIAYIPLCFIIMYVFRRSPLGALRRLISVTLLAFIPIAIHHVLVYIIFNHGYLYWVNLNQTEYHYSSRFLEYVKSLGSLLTFLVPIALGGFVIGLIKLWKAVRQEKRGVSVPGYDMLWARTIFICGVVISSVPAIMWPGITQRVLFMTVPGTILLACIGLKRYERWWKIFLAVAVLSAIIAYSMDLYLLDAVNLPF